MLDIRKPLLLVIVFGILMQLGGCVVVVRNPQYPTQVQPQRSLAVWYYYPDSRIYYNSAQHYYYYPEGNRWRKATVLPRGFIVNSGHRVVLREAGTPYLKNNFHQKMYPPKPVAGNKPVNHHIRTPPIAYERFKVHHIENASHQHIKNSMQQNRFPPQIAASKKANNVTSNKPFQISPPTRGNKAWHMQPKNMPMQAAHNQSERYKSKPGNASPIENVSSHQQKEQKDNSKHSNSSDEQVIAKHNDDLRQGRIQKQNNDHGLAYQTDHKPSAGNTKDDKKSVSKPMGENDSASSEIADDPEPHGNKSQKNSNGKKT